MYDTTEKAESIVSRIDNRLTNSERTRFRSSLEIDLHIGEEHAINRALRTLESHRLGYRSSMSKAEVSELAEIRKLIFSVS
ncbi:hypothetical protein SEA_WATERT_121 [Microbacterium phage WaterT]|nr:hypothetical protein SEA_WATERT_121 [Microbacterium phage WaterT]